ncbi:hypothetical protein LWI29_000226 [Acer saccharum]|uniref:Reverse transcriptase domain-containing protein n=1 Tax=Acer saccharum TaxID=4024 RepID=A0AA39RLA9_ACESA|nr:hypothetical protein LWI29_000226 [Acer saccharum]
MDSSRHRFGSRFTKIRYARRENRQSIERRKEGRKREDVDGRFCISIGETPYAFTFGSEAAIPTDTSIPTRRVSLYNPGDNEEELRACFEELEERRDLARIRTAHHQLKVAKYHDNRIRIRRFNPRDLVLKKVISATKTPSSGSLGDKWEGPYIVDSVSMKGAYKLKTEDGTPLRNPWNADHLKKYYQ